MTRREALTTLAAATMAAGLPRMATAQSRDDTIRFVTGSTWNQLDPASFGSTREALGMSVNVYDRLVTFGTKPDAENEGAFLFDFETIEPELCESYAVSDDGLEITFTLKPDAVWHDGSPVTAEDVKWSLDRMVTAELMSVSQMATGSLTSADQFSVVDARTVKVTLPQADRLALPNLATYFAPMFNATLARSHATEDDPWALEWLRTNTAAGGAYRVERMAPDGQQVVLARNEAWSGGTAPGFARVIVQTVPEPATRTALMQKGDADLCMEVAPTDVPVLDAADGLRMVQTSKPSGFVALCFNTQMAPFDDIRVRRAIAMALPYDRIFDTAANGVGTPLFGADWDSPPSGAFPQPMPLAQDLEAAKALLAEAGQEGLETDLYYSISRAIIADPTAALVQEALARIGVTLNIRKTPDAQYAEIVTAKTAPMTFESSNALFPSTEYFFRIFLSGASQWNFSSWSNEEVARLLPEARFEPDGAAYEEKARRLVELVAEEVPMAMLWQPTQDTAVSDRLAGLTTWYSYKADFRQIGRG